MHFSMSQNHVDISDFGLEKFFSSSVNIVSGLNYSKCNNL